MEEKNLHPAESLQIISTMINTAKNKLADDGFLMIFWGWLVFAAALIHYITIMAHIPYGEWVWATLLPAGAVVSLVYGYRQKKTDKVKTYVDTYLGFLWAAFIIGMFITLAFMQAHGIKATYFFLMILYGMATFISGGIIHFRPLIIGSLFSFAAAVCSVFLSDVDQLLCISAALLFSYIIPGHLLRAKFKSQTHV